MADPLDAPGLDDALAARLLALEPRLRAALDAERAEAAARGQTLARRLVEAKRLPPAEVAGHLAALAPAAATPKSPAAAPGGPVRRVALPRRLGPGDHVGGHVVERRLGEGGMGTVYAARQEGTGALRALKVLDLTAAPDRLARFQREAEAMARVDDHPHVVRVFGAGTDAGLAYLVLELVPGGDLASRFAEAGPLDPDVACGLVEPLCGALAHLHARGILHRDLKPQNVLLDADGRPRLADFGLAAITGAEALTRTGAIVGSPAYMAPEQVGGRAGVDARTDVYGLGAVLYELLTGRPPFGEGCLAQVLAQVMTEPPTPVRQLAPGVSQDLEAVCLRCLAKDPADRYPDPLALAADLARARRGAPRSRGGSRRGGRLVLGLAGAALAAGVLTASALVADVGAGAAFGPSDASGRALTSGDGRAGGAPGARARAEYLARCRRPFGVGPRRLAKELAALTHDLAPEEEDALRAEKSLLLADRGWGDLLVERLGRGLLYDGALAELEAVIEAPPRVPLPEAAAEALDRALLAKLAGPGRGDLDEVAEFELRRARLLGFARRPPEALTERLRAAGPSFARSVPVLRAMLWADCELAELASPVRALVRASPAELDRARAREPRSQALAFARLSGALDVHGGGSTQRGGLLADARLAASGPPSDLGPYWQCQARLKLAAILQEALRIGPRPTGRGGPTSGHQEELLEEYEAVALEVQRFVVARAGARRASAADLVELRALTRGAAAVRERFESGAAAWLAALDALRPLLALEDQLPRSVGSEHFLAAAGALRRAGDPGARVPAAAALGAARRRDERACALAELLSCHLELPALRPSLGAVDLEHLPDLEALRRLCEPVESRGPGALPAAGWDLGRMAVRAAVARGDLELAKARAAVVAAWFPALGAELAALAGGAAPAGGLPPPRGR